MPAQWTGEVIGYMHLNRITAKRLSEKLGQHPKYLSLVLNGHREPRGAEQRIKNAISEIMMEEQAAKDFRQEEQGGK